MTSTRLMHSARRACTVAAMLALAVTALPAHSLFAQRPVVLKHVRVIDGNGGAPLKDATVVIAGTTIQSIKVDDTSATPPNVTVLDLTGKTIIPGLLSDHSHFGQVQDGKSGPGLYTRENVLHQLAVWQAYGVTSVTSLGLNTPLFYELRDQLNGDHLSPADISGARISGPEIFGADRGIGMPNGAPPVPMDPYRPTTPEEARAQVREMAGRHTDLIKVWVDDFHGALPGKMSPAIYAAVIDEAHKQHLRVAAHIFYLADAKQLVRDGVDILAHGVRDQPVDDEFIALMKQHKTWYIATLDLDEAFYLWAEQAGAEQAGAEQPALVDAPFLQRALSPGLREHLSDPAWKRKIAGNSKLLETSKQALKHNEANLKRLYDAGGRIGFGTDSGANLERVPGFAEHRELHLSVDAGLTPLQAIGLATKNAAALLQLTDRGTLTAGKRADFVVLDADPTVDIDNTQKISAVWHKGQQVSGPIASFAAK